MFYETNLILIINTTVHVGFINLVTYNKKQYKFLTCMSFINKDDFSLLWERYSVKLKLKSKKYKYKSVFTM